MTTACLIDMAVRGHYRVSTIIERGTMPGSGRPSDKIHIGDLVAYRLSTGEPAHGIQGKVIGLFNTLDGKTQADVEWDRLGSPRRLNITNLIKV